MEYDESIGGLCFKMDKEPSMLFYFFEWSQFICLSAIAVILFLVGKEDTINYILIGVSIIYAIYSAILIIVVTQKYIKRKKE